MLNVLSVVRLTGLHRAALVAAGSMIALSAALTLPLSAFAQGGPPIDGHTNPNDSRCLRTGPGEDPFLLNMRTPATGDPAPGSGISSWFMDESGLNAGSANPTSQWYVFFHLTGPGVDQKLTADITSESFVQKALFDHQHKECRIQTNVKTQIPSTFNGAAYPTGNYTITLKAWDDDQTREGGDLGTQSWKFTVSPGPSPTPTVTPTATPTAQASPVSGVLAASTTGPGLPKTGAGASGSGPDRSIDIAVVFALALVALSGIVAARTRRSRERSKP